MTMKRIKVIPFDMKYLEDYYINFNEKITRYQWPDPFESIEDAKALLKDFLDEMEKEETLIFAVVDADERFVGSVEMHGLSGDSPELGVWIIESDQGKGYAFDALNFMLDYAHREYGKTKFFYEADVRNAGSNKLLNKLSEDYEITDFDSEELETDSGKELNLQGHELKRKDE